MALARRSLTTRAARLPAAPIPNPGPEGEEGRQWRHAWRALMGSPWLLGVVHDRRHTVRRLGKAARSRLILARAQQPHARHALQASDRPPGRGIVRGPAKDATSWRWRP